MPETRSVRSGSALMPAAASRVIMSCPPVSNRNGFAGPPSIDTPTMMRFSSSTNGISVGWDKREAFPATAGAIVAVVLWPSSRSRVPGAGGKSSGLVSAQAGKVAEVISVSSRRIVGRTARPSGLQRRSRCRMRLAWSMDREIRKVIRQYVGDNETSPSTLDD